VTTSPSTQIYFGDHRRDPVVRMCSLRARGLWWDIKALAVVGEPYGALRINGQILGPENLAPQVGRSIKEVRAAWDELEEKQVPVVFRNFPQLLEAFGTTSLYWLRPCGKPSENLRTFVENGPHTPPCAGGFIAQLPGVSPVGIPESQLVGCWFVPELVIGNEKRLKFKAAGKKGGNPALLRDNPED
jgi:hypothetical protein